MLTDMMIGMYTENANRAVKNGFITPENLEPNPKNPLIASFFRNIGRADRLGSGVHKLFKYTKLYSGKDPVFQEGDVFRIIVPLDENYSFDMGIGLSDPKDDPKDDPKQNEDSGKEAAVLSQIKAAPHITRKQLAENTGFSDSTVKRILAELRDKKRIERIGSKRSGQWRIL